MKTFATLALAFAVTMSSPVAMAGPKSSLDGFQADGVTSDANLQAKHQTRREWLNSHNREAGEYWFAWDCKGKPCDNGWSVKIRKKAALVDRLPTDPKPPSSYATVRK